MCGCLKHPLFLKKGEYMPEIKLNIQAENIEEQEQEKLKEWEIEDAVRTLIRAEEIKQDVKLMKLVKPKLEEKAIAAKKVVDASEVLYGKEVKNENKGD